MKPSILILDEVSANLDSKTEKALAAGLASSKEKPTTIIVSHRAGMLEHCDRVLEIVDGNII